MGVHYFPYNPQLDPLGYALGQGLSQGIMGNIQNKQFGQDVQNIQQYVRNMQVAQQAADITGGGHWPGSQPSFPNLLSPMGQNIMGDYLMQQMLNPFATQQAKADLRYTRARTKAIKRGRNRIKELVDEGYTPAEAKNILDISHGLKPRASAVRALEQKSLPEQLSFWQTVYNKTLDPEWGSMRPTEDMGAARELAKQNLERITAEMRQPTQANGGLEADLKNAIAAIKSGAPRDEVFRRLLQAYPGRAAEIKRLLGMSK